MRIIHMRFEEKFRDYRKAFRRFDVNFDGTVEFHEFAAQFGRVVKVGCTGCEGCA